jgi:ribonuclease HI
MPQRAKPLPHVELFTDGACSGNPGPGGWAYIIRCLRSGEEIEASGGERQTTNNRMELLAVINGLKRLKEPCRVDLYADSIYVVNGLRTWLDQWKARGWRRSQRAPVKNLPLWQELDALRNAHQINASWVQGHGDHPENDRCDRLAVAAAERFKQA